MKKELKRGDRVLVEMEFAGEDQSLGPDWVPLKCLWLIPHRRSGYFRIRNKHISEKNILHDHPGVPVADLSEELSIRDALEYNHVASGQRHVLVAKKNNLRAAREAAQAPKFTEGQEVWVRAEVKRPAHYGDATVCTIGKRGCAGAEWYADPDDIRTEEP